MEKEIKIPEEINLLITKAITEELNEEDLLKIGNWLKADKANAEYFRNLTGSWFISGFYKENEFDPDRSYEKLKNRLTENKKQRTGIFRIKLVRWSAAAAASVIIFILGSLNPWSGIKKDKELFKSGITEIISPFGSRTRIMLSDGSEVWMNAGTRIKYSDSYNISERVLELEGEAFFSVKSDNEKPFIVKTFGLVVKALGTKFNVKSYSDELTETAVLVEGKIEVEVMKKEKDSEIYTLEPNQKLVVLNGTTRIFGPEEAPEEKSLVKKTPLPVKIDIESNIKSELYTSWKEDRWVILREPLSTLVTSLERRYNMKFRFADNELMDYKFTGIISNETIDQILEAIRLTAPARYVIVKDSVILYTDPVLKKKFQSIITKK